VEVEMKVLFEYPEKVKEGVYSLVVQLPRIVYFEGSLKEFEKIIHKIPNYSLSPSKGEGDKTT
jgi:hypothetical protein